MEVVLWGVRGSVPVCGKDFIRYGGSTTCYEVRGKYGESILLDAGSGIAVRERHIKNLPVICLTHYHIDHLIGLPFLSEFYNSETIPEIYAPLLNTDPVAQLKKLFDGVFCPVHWNALPSKKIHTFSQGSSFTIGSLKISTTLTNHPGGCVAYKITDGDWTFVYTGDHEIPFSPAKINDNLTDFISDADVILADATYTAEDHARHINWGHSHFNQWAKAVKPDSLLLFTHHNPQYTDKHIDNYIAEIRQAYPDLKIDAAREGCIIRKNDQVNYELCDL